MKHYSIWSNYIFTFKPLWQQKRRIALCFLAAAVLFVAVPVVGMMITSMMIGSLEQGISMQRFVCRALLAFAGYGVLSMAKSYLDARNDGQYIEARTALFLMDWIKKDLTVSMEQCEDAQIQKLKKKSENCIWANEWGIEGFMRHNLDLLKSLLGLFVYTLIVGIMNWKILAMLVGMSAVSAAAAYGVTRYYEKIKDPLAEQGVTMGYINREVDDVQSGKDIRIFGLGKWIVGKYDQAIKKCRRLYFQRDIREYGSNMLDDNISELRNYLLLEEEAPSGGKLAETDRIEVVFDHVSYRYHGAEEETLHDVSFRLASGEKLALVGLNGAGKTTIVKLMSGLYLPTSGTVYVNGISTRALDRSAYFAKQAAIFQEPFQTSYNIAENIALEETYDRAKLWKVLAQAGLDEKVKSLDRQLDTHLGKDIAQDGIMLSGGEMQKLLLARALYREAQLILLDEPTAALDALAETEIYQKYQTLMQGKSVLFISHRLASTRFCDRILLLAEGRIQEQGTHEELMQEQGAYYQLFQVQSKYYDKAEDGYE